MQTLLSARALFYKARIAATPTIPARPCAAKVAIAAAPALEDALAPDPEALAASVEEDASELAEELLEELAEELPEEDPLLCEAVAFTEDDTDAVRLERPEENSDMIDEATDDAAEPLSVLNIVVCNVVGVDEPSEPTIVVA